MLTKNILKPVILLILDGWGYAPPWGGNAISIANTPYFDHLWRDYSHTLLCASGSCVGLPGHERGNSEVGHLNLGTGRIPLQDSSRINQAIKDGSFFENLVLIEAIEHARKHHGDLHLIGLVSEGGIHSHLNHLFALLELCQRKNFKNVYIQAFTDGRDTDPMGALSRISLLEKKLKSFNFGKIATLSGRYYAMDRDNHWERTAKVYQAMVEGVGQTVSSSLKAVTVAYTQGYGDEYILPMVIVDKKNKPIALVKNGDSIIFFNFRADRARQISQAFMAEKMPYFKRKKIDHLFFVGMIPYGYEEELKLDLKSAFKTEMINNPLAKAISDQGLKQLHLAETEKYAHVTYFFNGGREEPFPGEDRLLIPSPRVANYSQKPEMSVNEITEQLLIKLRKYDFIVVNFANGDMVGHTGNFKAAVRACEAVDQCLGKIISQISPLQSPLLLTADHGNCEEMINIKTGEPHTEHTKNPVPFILVSGQSSVVSRQLRSDGVLADVAPTILEIMDLEPPKEMTGKSLLV